MKKCIMGLLSFVLIVLILFVIMKDSLAKRVLLTVVAKQTGFVTSVEEVNINLFKHTVRITNLKLENPADFKQKDAFELSELMIDFDLPSLFSDQIHIYDATIDLAKVAIVKQPDDSTNIGRLIDNVQQKDTSDDEAQQNTPEPEKQEPADSEASDDAKPTKGFIIDHLTLAFGTAVYYDYSENSTEPDVQTLKLDKKRTYKDVTSAQQIVADIAAEVLMNQGLREVNKWAKDNADSLGIKKEEVDKATQAIGGFLNALRSN